MRFKWQAVLLSLVFVLSACGAVADVPTPRPPTITPTPISTPLPYIPTAEPAGFGNSNPIQVVIVPEDAAAASANLEAFQSALQSLTDVSISVSLAESQAEALDTLCASDQGIVAAVWLDGMTSVAGEFANCGIGVLQAETANGTGESGVLLLSTQPLETDEDEEDTSRDDDEDQSEIVAALAGTFCRISVDDLYSWTLPVLYYGAEGVTPADFTTIEEVADNDALIADLLDGDCTIAGMSEAAWEAYLEADEDGSLQNGVRLMLTSPEVPFKVFNFSAALSLDAIEDIEYALLQMEANAGRADLPAEATEEPGAGNVSVSSDVMTAMFGESVLVPVGENLNELFNLFESSGISFSELDS